MKRGRGCLSISDRKLTYGHKLKFKIDWTYNGIIIISLAAAFGSDNLGIDLLNKTSKRENKKNKRTPEACTCSETAETYSNER